ncbi:MAG TPA: TonB-dependent receptor plug domain-containing protein [Flavipsychrobacter sp.]|nr:TonB-dependent receptor plug domain-containing protein [Flavipsychrobacter sp.]
MLQPLNGLDFRHYSFNKGNRRFLFTNRTAVFRTACLTILCISGTSLAFAQESASSAQDLKKLTIEQLMNIEVTSVSRGPEKLSDAASAIQVVTGTDIRRSATTLLPEALRLAPNLQVAQSNSQDWSISSRGFSGAPLSNSTLANKLLVMIDGRSVYSPLFGGVFWDVQNVLLEDIDRIEVISGPGGTMWGANAVNGVINIVSKEAKETQGLYLSETAGTFLTDKISARYGSKIGKSTYYRVYGQHLDRRPTFKSDGSRNTDNWSTTLAGFRVDHEAGQKNKFTLQGDFYGGVQDSSVDKVNGQNVLGRWTHTFSETSNFIAQAYFDRAYRNLAGAGFRDQFTIYDLDLQQGFALGNRQNVLAGAGYRHMYDNTIGSASLSFVPEDRNLELFNVFIQDRIELLRNKLDLTVGTKALHNDYTGWEWQPSARIAWTPSINHTLWAAVSRAVRTPSRFDAEERFLSISNVNHPIGSEKVAAYELGYRTRIPRIGELSISTFYNNYDQLRSLDTTGTPSPLFRFGNGNSASSYGVEIAWNLYMLDWWRVRGGFTYLDEDFRDPAPPTYNKSYLLEAVDPKAQALLQSIADLPKNFQLDVVGRYVADLPALVTSKEVPAYADVDVRIAWIYKRFTFSIAGRNLAHDKHLEFGSARLPRSVNETITYRF